MQDLTQSPRRRSPAPLPAAQPLRHQDDGLAVDLGVIPLTHRHLEIRRARGKRRAGPPAIGLEQIGGRGQHIWNGMAQIDMAVAVVVDAVLDVRRRQKLCLADLAGIGADEIAQRQIAALDDLQGGDKLALEQLGAAAVMRQRRHRADHRQLAHVAGAVVAFQRPDRHDHRRGHAELLLDAPEQRGVHLYQFPGAADAGRDDPGGGVFLEALGVEHAALAAVEGEDGGVGRQAGEGLVEDRARDALALRIARDRGQESVEVAAAWRGERGGGEEQQDEGKEEATGLPHPRILTCKDPTSHAAGPKPTCKYRRSMSAFGGKADIEVENVDVSANDPKRT